MSIEELFGEPSDVVGECNARLYIGDNFGDNQATMRCQRQPRHDGKHREVYQNSVAGEVVVEWDTDERRILTISDDNANEHETIDQIVDALVPRIDKPS